MLPDGVALVGGSVALVGGSVALVGGVALTGGVTLVGGAVTLPEHEAHLMLTSLSTFLEIQAIILDNPVGTPDKYPFINPPG